MRKILNPENNCGIKLMIPIAFLGWSIRHTSVVIQQRQHVNLINFDNTGLIPPDVKAVYEIHVLPSLVKVFMHHDFPKLIRLGVELSLGARNY